MANEYNPGVATVLSFFISGLGQIYKGQIAKGLLIMSVSFASIIITILGAIFLMFAIVKNVLTSPFSLIGLVLLTIGMAGIVLIGIYNIYDAYYSRA